jgi:hypothetical protein
LEKIGENMKFMLALFVATMALPTFAAKYSKCKIRTSIKVTEELNGRQYKWCLNDTSFDFEDPGFFHTRRTIKYYDVSEQDCHLLAKATLGEQRRVKFLMGVVGDMPIYEECEGVVDEIVKVKYKPAKLKK